MLTQLKLIRDAWGTRRLGTRRLGYELRNIWKPVGCS